MTGFSAKQTRALGRSVKARFVRQRQIADGRELSYIEGWHAIAEANRIFGFDGWNRETIESRCVMARENRGAFLAIYVAKVRITVRTNELTVVREGFGAGEATAPSLGEAHEKAIKTAETDATKRALATFGKPFGLALYAGNRRSSSEAPAIPNEARRRTRQERGANGRYRLVRQPQPNPSHPTTLLAGLIALKTQDAAIVEAGESLTEEGATEPTSGEPPTVDVELVNEVSRQSEDSPSTTIVMIERPRRKRNANHLRFVAGQPCLVCSRTPSDPHHLQFTQPRAMSKKVSDEYTVPLCRIHHRQLHHSGDEVAWWIDMDIDPLPIAQELWRKSKSEGE